MLSSSGKGLTVRDTNLVCPTTQVFSTDLSSGATLLPLAEVELNPDFDGSSTKFSLDSDEEDEEDSDDDA